MARKHSVNISLDSLLDILTCLQGALMLIIVTTGIDAAQTKVLIATPIELTGKERPIYIECRNNELFLVPIEEARQVVQTQQAEVMKRRNASSDLSDVLEAVGSADVDIGTYIVDFTRYMGGQIALRPKQDKDGNYLISGYKIVSLELETADTWYGGLISRMDRDNERINFFVRDDSFKVFKLARYIAWTKKIKVTYSLIPRGEPLIF